ncbi:MAG: cobaltochelatase subunit CobT [Proteobacteria bacterium]|nr:cobaltochelatase subunit CobT [Pseudomonadota bacterium]
MSDRNEQKFLENFKAATVAALRALARRKDVEVSYSADGPVQERLSGARPKKLKLPVPGRDLTPEETARLRGQADTRALHVRHHDPRLHLENAPMDLTAGAAFEALERARCEALGARQMEGVKQNLSAALENYCRRMGYHNISTKDDCSLSDALYISARLALSGETPGDAAAKVADLWQPWLKEKLGGDGFQALAPLLADQKAFAALSRKLIGWMDMKADDPPPPEAEDDEEQEGNDGQQDSRAEKDQKKEQPEQAESQAQEKNQDEAESRPAGMEDMQAEGANPETDSEDAGTPQMRQREGYIPGPGNRYTIYTTAYDEIVDAGALADPEELERLRAMLDQQLSSLHSLTTKLANRLQRRLMAKQQRSWQFDLDEGYLDPARLARMIANPTVPLVYKQERATPFRDTVVAILIDNSGSMRGRPIAIAAMCTDVLARTLERCGVKCEILGFTTRAWKGGKARDLWIQNNRPPHPGRLNDLRHIIYKGADAPWRRTRKNLGLMLKEGLLKENIDGEALAWAYNRMAQRPEQRKILMVISDGAPVDDSTLSVNPSNILEQDLRNVISWIEDHSGVELTAIGIGHDVTRYYKKALTIADADELAPALIGKLDELFEETA